MISIGNVVEAAEGVRYFDEAVAESQIDHYAGRGLEGTVERDNPAFRIDVRSPQARRAPGRTGAAST